MSSFLVLCEGDTKNRWRDGQVCPDVGQETMAPWARRLGRRKKDGRERGGEKEERRRRRKKKRKETEKEKKKSQEERDEPALYGEKG
ncbi:hypothetical protein TNCV_804981 [Trichonephila clavipes]|nr:hypothetical protein TNCV_804981 [Trichonephila clavipes]